MSLLFISALQYSDLSLAQDGVGPTSTVSPFVPSDIGTSQGYLYFEAIISDNNCGDSNISESPPAEWVLLNGTSDPTTADGSGTPMTFSDSQTGPKRNVFYAVLVRDWPKGSYTFWVHGQDEHDNWGPWVSHDLSIADDEGPLVTIGPAFHPNWIPLSARGLVYLNATFDDTQTGSSEISSAEWYLSNSSAPPEIENGTGTPLFPLADESGGSGPENRSFSAAIDIREWPQGYYKLWVRANDTAGNWCNWTKTVLFIIEPEDKEPPEISEVSVQPPDPTPQSNVQIRVRVADSGSGVRKVVLFWTTDNWQTFPPGNQSMTLVHQDVYVADLGNFEKGTVIEFYVHAYDKDGNLAVAGDSAYTIVIHESLDYIDGDGDGIPDAEDPDDDNDGLSDLEERLLGSDFLNPDTDGDGYLDGEDPAPLKAARIGLVLEKTHAWVITLIISIAAPAVFVLLLRYRLPH